MTVVLKKRILSTTVAALTLTAGTTAHADAATEIAELKKRIAQIEASVEASAAEAASPLPIVFSGAVEVEAGYERAYDNSKSTDIVLATAELAVDADIAEGVSAHIGLLHEEDDTDLELDEGYITLEKGRFFVNAGQMYVPFGRFNSHLVSDPLTLEIGETRESTVEVGLTAGLFTGSAYVFKGDIGDSGREQSKVETYGISLTVAGGDDTFSYEFGTDYISSFADTDTMTDGIDDFADIAASEDAGEEVDVDGAVDDYVGGLSVDAALGFGPASVIVEYTTATEAFDEDALAFDGDEARPSAFNVEVGYLLNIGCETQFALALQGTQDAQALGLPERRIAVAASSAIADNTSLSLELARSTDYDVDDADNNDDEGDGETSDTVTIQLAIAF